MAGSFLSHALHILKIIITFGDVLLLIMIFFDISHSLEDRKISTHCTIHSCSLSLIKLTLICFSQYNFFFAVNMAWNLVFFCWKFLIEISFSVFSDTFRSKNFQNSNLHLCFILNQYHRQTTPTPQHPATNQEDNWTVDTTQWTLLKLEQLGQSPWKPKDNQQPKQPY